MFFTSTIAIFAIYSQLAAANSDPFSAARRPDQSFEDVIREKASLIPVISSDDDPSVYWPSKPYENFKKNLDKVPQVTDALNMTTAFASLRDQRTLRQRGSVSDLPPDFPRRISWMYPDDGCYARAHLMTHKSYAKIPMMKLFIFGSLHAKTSNHPQGYVDWWYHVAPIVRIGDVMFILDPAIEPERPLTLDEWIDRCGGRSRVTGLSICSNESYSPFSTCSGSSGRTSEDAAKSTVEGTFLMAEYERQKRLKRQPSKVLGDQPPWAHTQFLQQQLSSSF